MPKQRLASSSSAPMLSSSCSLSSGPLCLSPAAATVGITRASRRRREPVLEPSKGIASVAKARGDSLVTRAAPAMAAAAAQPGLAAIVAWASAALSAALTVFLLCAIPTLVVRLGVCCVCVEK